MSTTSGAPKTFRGYVHEANSNIIHIKSEDGQHEALIRWNNVKQTSARPYELGGTGTVRENQRIWFWSPDRKVS